MEEEDWEEEETLEVSRKEEEEEQEDDGEEALGSLGHRLRFCTGVTSQIDLLGKITLLSKTMKHFREEKQRLTPHLNCLIIFSFCIVMEYFVSILVCTERFSVLVLQRVHTANKTQKLEIQEV